MNNAPAQQLYHGDSLAAADAAVRRSQRMQAWVTYSPVILTVAVIAGFTLYKLTWFMEPFLDLIFAAFIFGQALAMRQFKGFKRRLKNTAQVIHLLRQAGDNPSIPAIEDSLRQTDARCEERDLVLGWMDLSRKGETAGARELCENARERQAFVSGNTVGIHNMINRTELKLGFLGTLLGLVATFPPMKTGRPACVT